KKVETDHPYINDRSDKAKWELAKASITRVKNAFSTLEDLSMLYNGIRYFLTTIAGERAGLPTIGKAKPLVVENYLPATFTEFVINFQEIHQNEGYQNGTEDLAEAIIMGGSEITLNQCVPQYREAIKAKIFELLIYDHFEEATINRDLDKYGHENVLEMMKEEDFELQTIRKSRESETDAKAPCRIAEIILRARDAIDWAHGRTPTRIQHREDPRALVEIRRSQFRVVT
ncbi:hypothetical protein HZA40_00165, partial [Candidatus Peregrinibacteria bacterium]|nr:hypothetical protein [Candidatus Peregrinibacteria bacterium]